MFLIVGLGNPGSDYKNTRHNVGFMAADALFRRYNFTSWRKRFDGETADGEIDGEKVILLKPATFMNSSGVSVQKAMAFYKIPLKNIVVFHDDMDVEVGKLKGKSGGGAGGHNGLKSIDAHCGADYTRIRMGIGRPSNGRDPIDWVLSKFSKEDTLLLDGLLDDVMETIPFVFKGGFPEFTSRLSVYQQKIGKKGRGHGV